MNGMGALDRRSSFLDRPHRSLVAMTMAGLLGLALGCERNDAAQREREIRQLETTIRALEQRVESGEYPNLEDSMKRQLAARRAELAELRAAQGERGRRSCARPAVPRGAATTHETATERARWSGAALWP